MLLVYGLPCLQSMAIGFGYGSKPKSHPQRTSDSIPAKIGPKMGGEFTQSNQNEVPFTGFDHHGTEGPAALSAPWRRGVFGRAGFSCSAQAARLEAFGFWRVFFFVFTFNPGLSRTLVDVDWGVSPFSGGLSLLEGTPP